jgi:molybdate transport system ATP-binding protein
MQRYLIRLKDVDVFLEGEKILSKISWRLKPGENWAVIGPNGAGKSTFLKLIRGDVWPWPHKESIRTYDFGGGPQETPIGIKRHMAFVTPELQDAYTEHARDMKTEEVVYTGFLDTVWLYKKPARAQIRHAQNLMEFLGVKDLRKRNFLELSRGEARKMLIARALVSDPAILILDEFCNGLDARSRKNMLGLLENVVRNGTQIIYATHRSEEFIPSISHVLFIKGGRIEKQGEKGRVLTGDNASALNSQLAIQKNMVRLGGNIGKAKENQARLIEITGADVYLDGTRVLQGIGWRVNKGEHWAIIGENGAGKSTLLKLISGDLHPALGGEVRMFERENPASIWDIKKKIGFISSDLQAGYPGYVTGREVVCSGLFSSIGLYSCVRKDQEEIVDGFITFFNLEKLAGKPVCEMSYGEFRKILIARAMVNNPEILILDEPFSGLDISTRKDVLDFLDRVSRGTTVILVTHHLDELIPSLTHVMLLAKGKIVAQGEKKEILPRVLQKLAG